MFVCVKYFRKQYRLHWRAQMPKEHDTVLYRKQLPFRHGGTVYIALCDCTAFSHLWTLIKPFTWCSNSTKTSICKLHILTLVKSFLVGNLKSHGIMAITVEARAVRKSCVSQEKVQRQSYSHVKIIRYVK